MNGKVARALRHLKANTLDIRDAGIISRRLKAQEASIFNGPKPLVTRQRRQAFGYYDQSPARLEQRRLLIVMHPVRAIELHEDFPRSQPAARVAWRNLTGAYAWSARSAGRIPKHVLDRLAA